MAVVAACGPDATYSYSVEIDNHGSQPVIVVPSGIGIDRGNGPVELGDDAAYVVAAGAMGQLTPDIRGTASVVNGQNVPDPWRVQIFASDCTLLLDFEARVGVYLVTIEEGGQASVGLPDRSQHPAGPYLPDSVDPCN